MGGPPFLPGCGGRARGRGIFLPPMREENSVSPAQNAFPNLLPPAAPFLSAAKEMGERTPPKTRGFWISFWSISMRWKKVPQGIGHGPALAAADVAGREHWQFYRFKRLSNRALAAAGRKCRCGPLGRKIRQASAPPRGARERQRGWGYKRFVVQRSAYILVFAGYAAAFYDAVSRAGSLETCGFKQRFWSLLGLRPKVTRARGAEYSPCWGHGGNMSGPSGTPAPTEG